MSDHDQLTKSRTQYDVHWRELITRNFVAGFSRSLGMILGQIIFFVVVLALLSRFVLPTLTPLLDSFQNATDIFNQLRRPATPTDLQNILYP